MHQCHGIASSCYYKLDGVITDVMTHEYNTRTKKEAVVKNEALAKVEENIISTINCLKEEP